MIYMSTRVFTPTGGDPPLVGVSLERLTPLRFLVLGVV